jgi:uncharacterized protein YbaR (Trm112 family)
MIDPNLLEKLCCPETHQKLSLADPALIEKLNHRIAAAQLRNRAGQPLTVKLDGGLVRQDGQLVYPIRQGIPILLIDEGVPVGN